MTRLQFLTLPFGGRAYLLIWKWYGSDTEVIWRWYGSDKELIWEWYWSDMEVICKSYASNMEVILKWYGSDTEVIYKCYGSDMEAKKWTGSDLEVICMWYGSDIEVISIWFVIIHKTMMKSAYPNRKMKSPLVYFWTAEKSDLANICTHFLTSANISEYCPISNKDWRPLQIISNNWRTELGSPLYN